LRKAPTLRLVLIAVALIPSAYGAVPIERVGVKSVQRSPSHGPSQSYLGIDFRDIGDDQVAQLKLKDTRGAEIIRVDHDAPAGKMGLREHDVVLQMNGVPIEGEEQLRRMLHDTPPGKLVALTIGRDGQTLTVSAPMADRAELERQAWLQHLSAANGPIPSPMNDEATVPPVPPAGTHSNRGFLGSLLPSPTYTGMMLESLSPQLAQFFGVPVNGGLLVRSVAGNSPASVAGIRAGDVLVKTNAKAVGNLSHWAKTLHEAKGKPITVVVMRDRQVKTMMLTPDVKHKSSLELPSAPTGQGESSTKLTA